MDEKKGPIWFTQGVNSNSICARVRNSCDQCLRNREKKQYNSGYNIGHNRRKWRWILHR